MLDFSTVESDFEYQMVKIIRNFRKEFRLEKLTAEEFQNKVWETDYLCLAFGRMVLKACNDFAGDEIFDE